MNKHNLRFDSRAPIGNLYSTWNGNEIQRKHIPGAFGNTVDRPQSIYMRDFWTKMPSINVHTCRIQCVQRIQLFPALSFRLVLKLLFLRSFIFRTIILHLITITQNVHQGVVQGLFDFVCKLLKFKFWRKVVNHPSLLFVFVNYPVYQAQACNLFASTFYFTRRQKDKSFNLKHIILA